MGVAAGGERAGSGNPSSSAHEEAGGGSAGDRVLTLIPHGFTGPAADSLKKLPFASDALGQAIRDHVRRVLPAGSLFRLWIPGLGNIKSSIPIADIPEGADVSVVRMSGMSSASNCARRLKTGAISKPSARNAQNPLVIQMMQSLHDTNQTTTRTETKVDLIGDLNGHQIGTKLTF